MPLFEVLVITHVDRTFIYEGSADIQIGQVVLIPFKKDMLLGIVFNSSPLTKVDFPYAIRSILQTYPFIFSNKIIAFISWIAQYNFIPLGAVARMILPFSSNHLHKMLEKISSLSKLSNTVCLNDQELNNTLNHAQQNAVESLRLHHDFSVDLLDGVTGSGKTEVYLSVLMKRLKNHPEKNQILILLPEITLTESLIQRFQKYFNIIPDVWHSNTSIVKKRSIWKKAILGEPLIVIGARSALFLPFQNLSMIVVDEEHDPSYKQNEQGSYHARDMAVLRAKLENIPILLASATPSLETIYNVQIGKYKRIALPSRYFDAALPQIQLVDMRNENGKPILSEALSNAMHHALFNNEQILLFVNQRGYAPVSLCRTCGFMWKCPMCDINLIEYKQNRTLHCHHCGFVQATPDACPECNQYNTRILIGVGTERVLEAVNLQFSKARCLVISSDTIASEKEWKKSIDSIYKGDVDIILGTQILAKGHHFPNLTVVGIIEADRNLNGCDLRANERTYQLLHQVAGRAGREQKKGEVFLQTYNPNHPLMIALQSNDREQFYQYELSDREKHHMPPFNSLIAILISGKNEDDVKEEAKYLAKTFPKTDDYVLLGPAPAPITRIRGKYRYRLLIKTKKQAILYPSLKNWAVSRKTSVSIHIDVDPYDFL